ncbi:MAG: NAD(+) synthase [Kiritimatiellae bacterium]|nr:NAD(+) synthase [Kiritimatiellia bacterium]
MKNSKTAERYGSLANHRAFLGRPAKKGPVEPFPCRPGDVFAKQAAGLARRLSAIKTRDAVIGVSGGLDSALALLVAAEAFDRLGLPRKNIHAFSMPGFGTTGRTKGNAAALCEDLGVALETIDIRPACRRHFKDIGHDGKTPDTVFENAQARMRTLVLMDKANMTGGIVVGTGDLSEIALGWCTFNGDHMAMFSVNNNVPKTVVRKVCAWWAGRHEGSAAAKALLDIIDTPVSPELVKGQKTENTIGPYELHDFFLWNFIMNEMGSRDLAKAAEKHFGGRFGKKEIESTLAIFMRRFFTQAYKRNCQCDGVKVFDFELSPHGWWIPSDLGFVRL